MANKVSLDTQIMIWGVKKEAIPEQLHMIDSATLFIEALEKKGAKIFISSVVLGELICKLPPDRRTSFLAGFNKRFMVIPFDGASALEYANIYYGTKNDPEIESDLEKMGRKHVKADLMVISASISNGMSVLYSEDSDLRKLAEGYIPAYPIDMSSLQMSLLDADGSASRDFSVKDS